MYILIYIYLYLHVYICMYIHLHIYKYILIIYKYIIYLAWILILAYTFTGHICSNCALVDCDTYTFLNYLLL